MTKKQYSTEFKREAGAVRVDLGRAKTNKVAQGLYEKNVFVKDTVFYGYGLESVQ
ncbi:hypothetical protein MLD52_19130 [Puniceicoccaceae bacterium K14]|nr:hypothetical protein [Puniceicoccaceae bacterium K14]